MLSPNSERYLQELLSYVKFAFDRESIRKELVDHITDEMDYYIEQGCTEYEAEIIAIQNMGDAEEIGTELNKQHNPIIGWIWRITSIMVRIMIVLFSLFVLMFFSYFNIFTKDLVKEVPRSEIVYRIDLKKKVKIDDTVIKFTNLLYLKNGDMNIYYEAYNTRIIASAYNIYPPEVSDKLGNKYSAHKSQQSTGIITKGSWTIEDFSSKADTIIIAYNQYNRKFRLEIPLKAGEINE
jgi:hypothetical protein